jgi:hypothetical protein
MNSKETFSTLMMDKNFWPEWINSASSIPHEKHRKTSKNIEKHRKTSKNIYIEPPPKND